MERIKYIFAILVILLAIPLGAYLRHVTGDEVINGRKYIKAIFYLSALFSVLFLILRKDYLVFTCLFILLVSYQSLTTNKRKRKLRI